MSKQKQNEIYLSLNDDSIIDGDRLKTSDNYLGAVTEKVANTSESGMDGTDLQDWLCEGQWTGKETIASVAKEWDELNESL